MTILPPEAVAGTTIMMSGILVGNAITQSFMGVPALLVDFPSPPSSPDHAARARLLGRQWPVFWRVGNSFFRPISTLGIVGYAYVAWCAADTKSSRGDWGWYALAACCHVVTVVHSAVNMQPLNERLSGLGKGEEGKGEGRLDGDAEGLARQWIRFNGVRIVMPFFAGSVALWRVLGA